MDKRKKTQYQNEVPVTDRSRHGATLISNKSGVYASLGQQYQDSVYQDLTITSIGPELHQGVDNTPRQLSSGVYTSLRLKDYENVYQDLNITSTGHQAANRTPKEPSTGSYASLGQRDQDKVYQDLKANTKKPNSKTNQASANADKPRAAKTNYHARSCSSNESEDIDMHDYTEIEGLETVYEECETTNNRSQTKGMVMAQGNKSWKTGISCLRRTIKITVIAIVVLVITATVVTLVTTGIIQYLQ